MAPRIFENFCTPEIKYENTDWIFLAQETVHNIKLYKWAPANTGVNNKI